MASIRPALTIRRVPGGPQASPRVYAPSTSSRSTAGRRKSSTPDADKDSASAAPRNPPTRKWKRLELEKEKERGGRGGLEFRSLAAPTYTPPNPAPVVVTPHLVSAIRAADARIAKTDPEAADPDCAGSAEKCLGEPLSNTFLTNIFLAERATTKSNIPVREGPRMITLEAQQAAMKRLGLVSLAALPRLKGQKAKKKPKKPKKSVRKAANRAVDEALAAAASADAEGKLDAAMIARITAQEKEITGKPTPVKGGPTAKAQQHANEQITGQAVHDIAKGETKVSGSPDPVKQGPTATVQSEISKAQEQQDDGPVAKMDSATISKITEAEKEITGANTPVKDGPTAKAQQHANEPITADTIHDITEGEKKITGSENPVKGGPTATVQSELTLSQSSTESTSTTSNSEPPSTTLDAPTISTITEKEKEITGSDDPVRGGPTARAQQHAGEEIYSKVLHDITEGEKEVTGGERIAGGPTSAVQSELSRARNADS